MNCRNCGLEIYKACTILASWGVNDCHPPCKLVIQGKLLTIGLTYEGMLLFLFDMRVNGNALYKSTYERNKILLFPYLKIDSVF